MRRNLPIYYPMANGKWIRLVSPPEPPTRSDVSTPLASADYAELERRIANHLHKET